MKHVIFVAENSGLKQADASGVAVPSLGFFQMRLAHIEIMGARKLSGDDLVWLVDFQKHPDVLATLIHVAEEVKWRYAILPLSDAGEWIDPKKLLSMDSVPV